MAAERAHQAQFRSAALSWFFRLAVISCSVSAFPGCGRQGGDSEGAGAQAPPPAEVTVVTVEAKTIPVTFEAVGQTEGSREVEVRARVGGILLRRFYKEGEFVKRGTLLFRIDPAPYQAALNRLKGALEQEQAQLDKAARDEARLKPLFAENAVSRKEYEDSLSAREGARARVQSARAALTEAQLNLGYTDVTASISGVTGRAEKSEGSLIAAGTDLLTRLSQIQPIYANFSYSENTLLRVREEIAAQQLSLPADNEFEVELELSDGSRYPERGKLNFNDFRVQAGTGTIQVRAVFPNAKRALLPGQFVRVILHGATRPNAILIPQQAAISGQKGKAVYVVGKDNKAESRPIETGEWREDQFLVTAGLQPGDRVITSGVMRLRPGAPVKIAGAQPEPAAQAPAAARKQR